MIDVLSDLDALPRSARITIRVILGAGREVLSVDLLNEHGEGCLLEVSLAASPNAQADGAGRLRILLTA